MEVFLLSYECLDSSDSGVLALYSNMHAAIKAKSYAESLNHYSKVYIERCYICDKFSISDFD